MLRSTTSRAPVIFAVVIVAAFLPAQPSRADDTAKSCLSSPNAAAPSGMHWYYHRDRKANRRCWYLGAAVRVLPAASEKTVPAEDKVAAATREAAMREAEAAFIAGPAAASPVLEKPTATEERAALSRALGLSLTPSYVAGDEPNSPSAQ